MWFSRIGVILEGCLQLQHPPFHREKPGIKYYNCTQDKPAQFLVGFSFLVHTFGSIITLSFRQDGKQGVTHVIGDRD